MLSILLIIMKGFSYLICFRIIEKCIFKCKIICINLWKGYNMLNFVNSKKIVCVIVFLYL